MDHRVVFAINGILIDLGGEALRDRLGKTIPLRRQSFAVLHYLIEHAERVVTKDELMAAVWPDTAVTDDSLVQCVHEIRRAFGDDRQAFLKTVPRRGYRLTVQHDAVIAAGRVDDSKSSHHLVAIGARHHFPFNVAALSLGVLLLAAATAAVWLPPIALKTTIASSGAVSVRVPLFGSPENPRKPLTELEPALAVELRSDPALSAPAVETTDIRAGDALLVGLDYLRRDTEEDTLKAIAAFERARDADPHYGRAYAAIAAAQMRMIRSGWRTTSAAGLDEAYRSLRWNLARALERPTSLAYSVAAEWALETGRIDESLGFIAKANAAAPNDPDVLVARARILNASGRAKDAETTLRLAMRLNAGFSPAALRALSVSQFQRGEYADAIESVERIKAQGSANTGDYITLTASFGQLGRTENVKAAIDAYNALALATDSDPISVQEAQWRWHGSILGYHHPYIERLAEGLRKAGVQEGAGADLPLDRYLALIMKKPDGQLMVRGAVEATALFAGALFDRGVKFIDVRATAGYNTGHVPGAVNLSLGTGLSKQALLRVAAPDDEIVFYCDSKYCGSSALAAAKAITWGYRRVYWLAGGIPAWKDADCPIEVASAQ